MKCSKCGAEFEGKFCSECGTPANTQIKDTNAVEVVAPTINEKNISDNPMQQQLELQKEQLRIQQAQLQMQQRTEYNKMICPRCHSNSVVVQAVAEQKKRGCLMSIFWILLAICTVGIALLLIPLLTKKGSRTRTYAVCQSCGNRWRV